MWPTSFQHINSAMSQDVSYLHSDRNRASLSCWAESAREWLRYCWAASHRSWRHSHFLRKEHKRKVMDGNYWIIAVRTTPLHRRRHTKYLTQRPTYREKIDILCFWQNFSVVADALCWGRSFVFFSRLLGPRHRHESVPPPHCHPVTRPIVQYEVGE